MRPYPDFPLCFHPPSGRLYKSIKGKRHYFGYARDWQAAIDKYEHDREALYAGRKPRQPGDGLTVRDLCNRFLSSKQRLLDSNELSPRTWQDYKGTADRIILEFGRERLVEDLDGDDFDEFRASIAKGCGPVRLANEIQRVRTVMKYAHDQGYIKQPVRFGSTFKRPQKKVMRKHKAAQGERMLESVELRACIDAAGVQLRAMILLACNGALGQSDISAMDLDVLDLEGGILDYPRVKTAIKRRVPLWKETTDAIREWLPMRPGAKDPADENAVFLTRCGQRWVKINKTGTPADALGQEFTKLLRELKLKRPGVSFYAIRHSFRTVADATLDFPAIDLVMGHSDNTMGGRYREHIDDARLRAVVDHVRSWLYGDTDNKQSIDEAHGGLRVVG
jgi:integrase